MEYEELSEKEKRSVRSKVMSEIAKQGHKKHPRPKSYYSSIVGVRWAKEKDEKDKQK